MQLGAKQGKVIIFSGGRLVGELDPLRTGALLCCVVLSRDNGFVADTLSVKRLHGHCRQYQFVASAMDYLCDCTLMVISLNLVCDEMYETIRSLLKLTSIKESPDSCLPLIHLICRIASTYPAFY